ncbi:hypothetical protein N7481_003081 [Penicillium waksmanii]|uniref:uncharacterized protein n=1 Tax=Penicillium waksmanii TaxID=69791 RepID=UPI002549AFFF|nr:uncharacterized protein N7481_003081 [Penicillium waksmanii]KAJ5987871.1 hypothetical protein N7481_003081 [Penicillium waksmanii]
MAVFTELIQSPYAVQGLAVSLVAVLLSMFWQDLADEIPHRRIPLIGKDGWDPLNKKTRQRFKSSARKLILEGFSKGANIFQIISERPLVVLHPKYIDEIKNHPHLDFQGAVERNFFDDRISGFEPFHPGVGGQVTVDLVRTKLTQALGSLTIPLSKESAVVAKEIFPPYNWYAMPQWTPYNFSAKIPYVVARLSTRAFLGEALAKNKDWIDISVNYTIDAFNAARELRQWLTILRPVAQYFLKTTRKLRNHLSQGKLIIDAEIKRRHQAAENNAKSESETEPRLQDTLDWFEQLSKSSGRSVNVSNGQIALSMAAIHTTSNLLTNIMYDLAAYPEYIQPLRDEIRAVVAEDGCLKKSSLLKLKLMDSVMKETQRLQPVSMISLNRLARKEIPLSDGTVIPKGAMIGVSTHTNEDETIYPSPQIYDGYRFYKKRQEPGNEQRFQFVTTSRESFGFGHGVHACPGRFFAANESKIFLVHLLLKYDWKLKGGDGDGGAGGGVAGRPANFDHGTEIITDPRVELLFRSRRPDIDLAALGE